MRWSAFSRVVGVTTTSQATARPMPTWLPLAAVATTLVLWASAFVAIRHLSGSYRPGSMALGRMLVGSLCLSLVAWRGRRSLVRPGRSESLRIVVIGVL